METLQEYTLFFDNASSSEKIIREFLLARANILRLTMAKMTEIDLFPFPSIQKKGGPNDPLFLDTLKELKEEYIKQVINGEKYNDITQPLGQKFEHYFFKLSEKMKEIFLKSGLLFDCWGKYFYGFEDPTFYKDDLMVCSIISHEPIIILYLTNEEKGKLSQGGVVFEKNDCGCGACSNFF